MHHCGYSSCLVLEWWDINQLTGTLETKLKVSFKFFWLTSWYSDESWLRCRGQHYDIAIIKLHSWSFRELKMHTGVRRQICKHRSWRMSQYGIDQQMHPVQYKVKEINAQDQNLACHIGSTSMSDTSGSLRSDSSQEYGFNFSVPRSKSTGIQIPKIKIHMLIQVQGQTQIGCTQTQISITIISPYV